MVQEYFPLHLTVAGDRLPALSGLAIQMQARTRDIYLAGLWLSSLLVDMLWYIEDRLSRINSACEVRLGRGLLSKPGYLMQA